jgi:signal transduction histidine kinase
VTVDVESDDAVVRVRDTGIGIPSERLGDIFELFTQLDAGKARTEGGLGIGLTLAKRLTVLHGGAISAVSDGLGRAASLSCVCPGGPRRAPEMNRPYRGHARRATGCC